VRRLTFRLVLVLILFGVCAGQALSQTARKAPQPHLLTRTQESLRGGRVIFRDAGYVPILIGNIVKLGPGQMAAVGFGRYAASEFDLGVQEDVVIPRSLAAIAAPFASAGHNTIETSVMGPAEGDLRIIFQQRGADGLE